MGDKRSQRVIKALTIVLVVSVAVSLTAASVSAWSSKEKVQTTQGKYACAKSMKEVKATSEKDTCAKQSSAISTLKSTCQKPIKSKYEVWICNACIKVQPNFWKCFCTSPGIPTYKQCSYCRSIPGTPKWFCWACF